MVFRRILVLVVLSALLAALVPFPAVTDDYKASTAEEFAGWVEYHASRLETSYEVPCEASLMEELKTRSPVDGKTTLLSELLLQFGTLGDYSVVWYGDRIGLENLKYYTGWRISRLQETGKTDLLSPREKETLNAALSLAGQASGTDLEKERFLFDALCAGITYDTDPNETDNDRDCAVGALLNGLADCDGYADAMLLCCSLAGVPCRYIHGRAVDAPDGRDGSHMWNLVCIENAWLMCDVTWGDRDGEEPAYLFFNIGSEDAAASYAWNPEILFTPVAARADFSVHLPPDLQPVSAVSQEDVYRAVRAAVSAGQHHLTLYCPEEILWQTDPETFRRMIAHGGAGTLSWRDSGRLYMLYDITLPDHPFCFCDSREEVLSAVRRFAEQGVPDFSLYFHPSLSEELFAADHAGLQQLLSESRLEEAGRYRYAEKTWPPFSAAGFRTGLLRCLSCWRTDSPLTISGRRPPIPYIPAAPALSVTCSAAAGSRWPILSILKISAWRTAKRRWFPLCGVSVTAKQKTCGFTAAGSCTPPCAKTTHAFSSRF